MKLLHLGDLHIGKKVNDFSMLNEQKNALSQAIEIIKTEKINTVLIAGDVFDKQIPSIEALEVFDDFLAKIADLKAKIFIIPGNHDSKDRLHFMSAFLKKSNIFIANSFNGEIENFSLDENIQIYLLPYLYPALIRKFFKTEKINSYNDAFRVVFENTKINQDKINILVAHQFVIGLDMPILSDSEQTNVGGIDNISYELFKDFDYVALGHLHCPQKCGSEKIRYSGSILKYSFNEINQKKCFTIIDIKSKDDIIITFKDIKPIHDFVEYKGYIDLFLDEKFYSKTDKEAYIHFILKDEAVLDAKKKLSMIYPNILLLEFDNSYTRSLNNFNFNENLKKKSLFEHFLDFYQLQYEKEPDKAKKEIIKNEFIKLKENSNASD